MIIRPMPSIPFTGNYEDLSTDRGYQFKFYCEKCGNGVFRDFYSPAEGDEGQLAMLETVDAILEGLADAGR